MWGFHTWMEISCQNKVLLRPLLLLLESNHCSRKVVLTFEFVDDILVLVEATMQYFYLALFVSWNKDYFYILFQFLTPSMVHTVVNKNHRLFWPAGLPPPIRGWITDFLEGTGHEPVRSPRDFTKGLVTVPLIIKHLSGVQDTAALVVGMLGFTVHRTPTSDEVTVQPFQGWSLTLADDPPFLYTDQIENVKHLNQRPRAPHNLSARDICWICCCGASLHVHNWRSQFTKWMLIWLVCFMFSISCLIVINVTSDSYYAASIWCQEHCCTCSRNAAF